jgi:SpoVK/Ycf46/Vps4 family AAA+-type ATPase
VPRAMLLHGPPGTGKTQIARTLANESGLKFIAASSSDIKQGWLGQSGQALREIFEKARQASPALLFIDEIDVITRARGSHTDSIVNEIVGQLLQEMEGIKAQSGHVFVLAATNFPEQIDPAVRSRFVEQIEIPLPDEDCIRRLLAVLLGPPKALSFAPEEFIERVVRDGVHEGKSGRDIHAWVKQAEQSAAVRAMREGHSERVVISENDFKMAG